MIGTSGKTRVFVGQWRVVLARAGELMMMAVMTQAVLVGELSPFSVAYFAASLFAGAPAISLLAGCALGGRWAALGWRATAPLIGCLLVWGDHAVLTHTALGARVRSSAGKTPFRSQDAIVAALSGVGTLVPALALSGGEMNLCLLGVVGALVALTVAPVMSGAVSLSPERTCLLAEEKLSLATVYMIALIGIARSPFSAASAPIAAYVTLVTAATGVGAAAVGVLGGAALAFTSTNPMIGASLGLMGLVAGATYPLGRGWSALAFVLINVATTAFGTGGELGTIAPIPAVAVALAYALTPERVLDRMADWLAYGGETAHAEDLAARLRHSTEKRLRALGSVFDELVDGYGEPVAQPDETLLTAQLRRALCAGCSDYARCWNGTDARAGRMLVTLLGDALRGDPLGEDKELPPEYGRLCRRAAQIPRRLGRLLTQFERSRRQARERQSAGDMLSRQFRQASGILGSIGDGIMQPVSVDSELSHLARAALEREGIGVSGVLALDTGSIEVTATIDDGLWDGALATRAAARLTRALGLPMRAALLPDGRLMEKELRFMQAPRLSATVGYASRARESGMPNGDAHLASGLTGGRVLIALSDGMGSGARAAKESAKTIRLIRRFMLADVDRKLMLDSVNQLLLMRGQEDMFATADLCIINLQEGTAEFLKQGCPASYILRRGQCIRVEGGHLPLGILGHVSPGASTARLRAGDTLVMFTDGIADTASEEESAWLEHKLRQLAKEAPGTLCERIIEEAGARKDGAGDDMTVVAVRIGRS